MAKQQSTYRAHFLFLVLYFLCNVTLAIHSGKNAGLFLMLVWNAFLSFLPCLFARHTALARSRQKRIWIIWALLWLIFWPNTFYVSTDIVHFTGDTFLKKIPYHGQVYSTDLLLWAKGISVVTVILYAVLNGVKSEITIERVISSGKWKQILFRAVCSFLCGVGIYIGRFLRLNSWDIFRPAKIAASFRLPGQSPKFISGFVCLLAAFVFAALSFAAPLTRDSTAIN
ncbi:MAG TPA: hypothetical protein DG942_03045 [Ruminococcaceae bacterium]|jgi:uncharacterized membrane protein|nr:hypothetical protein [Oscillospiraceae bacterium]